MLLGSLLTPADLVTGVEFRPLVLVPALAGVAAYVVGVRRLRAAGTTWPSMRSAAMAGSVLAVAVGALSGLADYRPVSFAIAAVAQLLLFILAPVLLALSAPLTLALEVGALRHPERAARRRAALTGGPGRVLFHPAVAWLVYAPAMAVAYLSPEYAWSASSVWAGQLADLELFVVGCLWIWPVVGADPKPRLGIGWRVGYVMGGFVFWSGLGLALQSQRHPIAPQVPLGDVATGGGTLWTAAALAAIAVSIGVVIQWLAVDEGHARSADRANADEDALQLAAWRADRRDAALADHRVRGAVAVRSRPAGTAAGDRAATSARVWTDADRDGDGEAQGDR